MPLSLPPIHKYAQLAIAQSFGKQQLARVPESEPISDQTDQVSQYDQVMTTKLAIAYAVGLEVIYRARLRPLGGSALDLCCGPGHYSLFMAQHLCLDHITGLDLAIPMVKVATRNAERMGVRNADFAVCDVRSLADYGANKFDLTTFADAAHHMPCLKTVRQVIEEMERVTKLDGLIVVMDLVRLRTAKVTEKYCDVVGAGYKARGLNAFYLDFYNSMFAAWTIEELASALPSVTSRRWFHLAPLGLPTIQFLIGAPEQQVGLWRRRCAAWRRLGECVERSMCGEWRAMRQSLYWSKPRAL
jgi:ubiquinone/menaquinone biosynthesis C-methylase UbiE